MCFETIVKTSFVANKHTSCLPAFSVCLEEERKDKENIKTEKSKFSFLYMCVKSSTYKAWQTASWT